MYCDAFRMPKSIIADANGIQMGRLQVRIRTENPAGEVSQYDATTFVI